MEGPARVHLVAMPKIAKAVEGPKMPRRDAKTPPGDGMEMGEGGGLASFSQVWRHAAGVIVHSIIPRAIGGETEKGYQSERKQETYE